MKGIMVAKNTVDKLCQHDLAKLKTKTTGFDLVSRFCSLTKTPHCTIFLYKRIAVVLFKKTTRVLRRSLNESLRNS